MTKSHSFYPKEKGKDFYPMNGRGYSGKVRIAYYGKIDGQDHYQAERWQGAAQHSASCTVNVDKFVERYQCEPMEAHTFYPETFYEPVDRS